ncbi:YadA-like family protein [Paraburkholderia haematera]
MDGFGLFVSYGDGFSKVSQPAFVYGTKAGDLVLHGQNGISMLDNVLMYGNQIKNLGAGDVSLSSTDGVNGAQLYQRTRYFNANSPSDDPSTDARAMGASSVASGPSSKAVGSNSSAYGANAVALVSNSVALGANSVASRNDSVSVGYLTADGKSQYTRQITNVTAGAAGTDAVNVNQLNAALAGITGGSGGTVPNAVTYNDSGMGLITLKGSSGTKITNLTAGDISSAWSTDAVNGSQLYQTNQNVANVAGNVTNVTNNLNNVTNIVNNIVNNGIAGSPLVVLYDTSSRNSLTLGGVGSTSPVKLTNVARGDISSASSTDAVNGGQLYDTNRNVANVTGGLIDLSGGVTNLSRDVANVTNTVNFITNGGGIKYFHTNSTLADSSATGTDSTAIGGASTATGVNSVALGSKSMATRDNSVDVGSRQITGVVAGTQNTDAVNVAQLNAAIAGGSGGGSPNAVLYDGSAHTKITLGAVGAPAPVALTNLAAGQVTSSSTDAVNGSQLYNTANSVAAALGGGASVTGTGTVTNPSYQLSSGTYSDVGQALAGLDGEIGAINTNVINTTKYISVASTASAASATGMESVAIGGGAKASGQNSLSFGVGSNTSANNSIAIGANSIANVDNTVSVGKKGSERRIMNVANGVATTDAVTFGQLSALQTTVTQLAQQSGGVKSMLMVGAAPPVTNYIAVSASVTQGTATSTDGAMDAMAIGPTAKAGGASSLAVGKGASTFYKESTAIGAGANAAAAYTTVIGSAASTGTYADYSVAVGYNANVGGTNALAMGSAAQADATNGISIGNEAFVIGAADNAVALGYNATASALNSVALGANSAADRANTVAVGSSSAQRQVVNMAAGTANTDAVNVSQLKGVTDVIGGGTAVNADGTIKKPSFSVGGQTYTDVGSAIAAAASGSGGSANSVQYDDTTKNTITLKGASGSTKISGLTAGTLSASSTDAVNGSQLYSTNQNVANVTGNVINITNTVNNITNGNAGVKYFHVNSGIADSTATGSDSIAIGPMASVTTQQGIAVGYKASVSGMYSVAIGSSSVADRDGTVSVGSSTYQRQIVNMAAGTANTDAVNVSQLKGVTDVIGGGTAVNADGTIKKPSFSVGGQTYTDVGSAIAAAASGSGGSANSVQYDDTTKNTITLKGASGSTKISGLTAGTLSASSTDAVNGSQLYSTNQNVANVTGNVINITNTVNNITNGNAGIKYFHVNSTLPDSSAPGTDAVAIGGNAKATANNSVALGSNSVASRANTVDVGSRQITDVAAGTQSLDAVNLAQLQAMGAIVDSSGNFKNAFVSYDDTTKNTITLKGANGSTKITGLTAGALSASSTDAVNGTQLYSTNQNVANMAGNVTNITNTVNNITNGGGIKYFHANSTLPDSAATATDAVAIGGNAKATAANSVALGANSTTVTNLNAAAYLSTSGTLSGTAPVGEVSVGSVGSERRLTNVAAGAASTDAVNVSQLQAAVTSASSTASANAVQYDSSSHNKVTLGGASTSPAVKLTNLAIGTVTSTSSDAVNGSQLYNTANSVAAALGGGSGVSSTGTVTSPTYKLSMGTYADVGAALTGMDGVVSSINTTITNTTKYISVVSTASAAIASGGEAVAIGGGAKASGLNSLAFGSGSLASADNSIALGANSVANVSGVISVGKKGSERKIVNVANGVSATDAVTFGQLQALQTTVTQLAAQSSGVKSMLLGAGPLLGDALPVTSYIAVSPNVTGGTATSTDGAMDAMAIGPTAKAAGVSSLAIGKGASTFHGQSTAIGAGANAVGSYTTVIGSAASTEDGADYSVAIGYNSNVGGVNSLAMGSAAQTDTSGSVAIGSDAYVTGGENSVAVGLGATASVANSVALGANSIADRANTVSVGAKDAERQIVNVKAGTADTDAVNVKQLNTAIATVSGGGAPNAVIYDSAAHDKVTFGNVGTPVALTNVAAGQIVSSSKDAVNGGQLYDTANSVAAALGGGSSVGTDGKVTKPAYALNGSTYNDVGAALAAVAAGGSGGSADAVKYDTTSHNKVTLGGAGSSTLVTVSNVADGVANNDAVNVKQLTELGAKIDSNGNVSGAFVAYDDSSKGKVTLGGVGSTTPVSLTNIATGQVTQSSKDAINGSQLYGTVSSVAQALGGGSSVTTNGTLTKPNYTVGGNTYSGVDAAVAALDAKSSTGSPDGVVYDTSVHDKLTLGGAGSTTPVQLSNVADAKVDNDAVNFKQLKAAGLTVDTSGNVTNSFVAYDNLSKDTVTFGGFGSTTPVQLKNVAVGDALTDAVNVGQMQAYVAKNAGGGGTANAVAYDDTNKNTVTLGGAGHAPVTLTNVAAGSNGTDAVNFSQFSSLQNQVNNISGGGGSTTYVNINTPSTGGTAASASGTDAIAIGNGAIASGTAAIAIGKDAVTAGDNSVAMGQGASAPNTNSVALGSNSTTDRDNSVSMGSTGHERQITNVAAGTQATDAVNLGQLNNAMGGMQQSINNVDRSAAKGIASASALNIVTPYLPGRTTLNAGIANYRGYQALGLGVSRWNEKGTVNYNLGVSSSGGNSTIVRAGIGIVLGN